MEEPGSIAPLLGRTQYRRGAVVFTLKHTRLSDGFVSFRLAVTTSVNGPEGTGENLATVQLHKNPVTKVQLSPFSRVRFIAINKTLL